MPHLASPISPLRELLPGQVLARGVARSFVDLGYSVLLEVPLPNGRRADVLGGPADGEEKGPAL